MTGRVLFYAQHLLGIGHLKRASLVARAMVDAGLDVCVVLGGRDVAGIDFSGCALVFLPSARVAGADFAEILDEDGAPVDDAWRDKRVARLLHEFSAFAPDVVLVEQFPFGRRAFRFELMPLLEAARTATPRVRTVASVRDVLVRKDRPQRNREMVAVAGEWFDRVLVHGNRRLIPLEATLPEAADIADRLVYTGYVAEPAAFGLAARRQAGRGEVVVSAGGGAVGEPLFRAALAARPLTRLREAPWRLVTGPNLPDAAYDALSWDAPAGVLVERARFDLPAVLANCVLSISQAGYNTVMDLLQARIRSVVVPFAEGEENEQLFRARALAERGLLRVVDPARLSPEILAQAVDEAMESPPIGESDAAFEDIDFSGAEASARVVAALCGDRTSDRD